MTKIENKYTDTDIQLQCTVCLLTCIRIYSVVNILVYYGIASYAIAWDVTFLLNDYFYVIQIFIFHFIVLFR